MSECSYTTLGYPITAGSYHPLADTTVEPEAKHAIFQEWVSSFFDHPDVHGGSITDLQLRAPTPAKRPSTHSTFSEAEVKEITDASAAVRSEAAIYGQDAVPQLRANFHRSVFDAGLAAKYLPELQVKIIYCFQTIWSIPWGIHEIKKTQEHLKNEGSKTRPVQFVSVENANHFVSEPFYHLSCGDDTTFFYYSCIGKTLPGLWRRSQNA